MAEFARASVLQRAQTLETGSGALKTGHLSGDLITLSEALGELDASLVQMRKRIRSVLGPSAPSEHKTVEEPELQSVPGATSVG